MATRAPGASALFPSGQVRQGYQPHWGEYASLATLPNAAGNVLSAARFTLQAGDLAYVSGLGLYVCSSPGTAGGANAVWGPPIPFSPLDLPSLTLWLDERGQVVATGISPWLNQSNAPIINPANATGAQQPVGGTLINGLQAPLGDGVNDRLASATLLGAIVAAGGHQVFAVFEPVTTAAVNPNGLLQPALIADNAGFFSLSWRDNAGAYEATGQIDDGVQKPIIAPGLVLGSPMLLEWAHGGNLQTIQLSSAVTPAPVLTGNIGGVAGDLRLFCNFNATVFGNHALATLLVFNAPLTAANVLSLRQYLSAKWAVSAKGVRTLGNWLRAGDSVDIGYAALQGGYWSALNIVLGQMGIAATPVGSLHDGGGNSFATSGQKASGVVGFTAECNTQQANFVTIGWGANDLIAGDGAPATLAAIDARIDDAQAAPTVNRIFVREVAGPFTGGFAAFEADRLAYNAGLPAVCAAQGVTLVTIPAVTTSDGLHPNQPITGYPVMARALAAAIVAAL